MGRYKQKGGTPAAVVAISDIILNIVKSIFKNLYSGIKGIIRIWPQDVKPPNFSPAQLLPNNNERFEWGLLWIYLWNCVRIAMFLVIFTFGGPLLIVIGIIYIYSKLATKFSEKVDETENA